MKIVLTNAGKRFNRDWIFKNLSVELEAGKAYAIIGSNGSGKSTFLQCVSGAMMLSNGSCNWLNTQQIPPEKIYRYISYCAPYLELVEEMMLTEFFHFHQSFKAYLPGVTIKEIIDTIGLQHTGSKRISQFSSGMKQRVKLAQCIFSNTPIVLLDEPCTNLDQQGIELYYSLLTNYCTNRLVLVGSNDPVEYRFCSQQLNMLDYK